MNPRQTAIVAGAVLFALAVIVALLLTGGPGGAVGFVEDPSNDVSVTQGEKQPTNTALADILHAEVTREGEEILFVAKMAANIPQDMDSGAMSWRFTISEQGTDTWLTSATINVEPNATVAAQQSGYAASTVDDTLPGKVSIDGDTLTITLQAGDIPDFPTIFDWMLQTNLDADLSEPSSGLLQDTAPDSGTVKLEP